jgi:hypothetical protein
LAEVKVVLAPIAGEELVTTTDGGGNYTFDKVPAGDYVLRTSKDGYIPVEKELTIEPLKGMVQDVTMKRNTLPGNTGFILDYDLSHSLMVVALGLALFISAAALIIRLRIKRPEVVEKENGEQSQDRS